MNKHSAICFFVVAHLQATRVDIFILGSTCSLFVVLKRALLFIEGMVSPIILNSSLLLLPTLIKSLNFSIGVSFRTDILTPFPLPALVACTLRSDVAIHIEHKINTRSVSQCIKYILFYFLLTIFFKILRSTWLIDIYESCNIDNRTFDSWICSTWLVNFL